LCFTTVNAGNVTISTSDNLSVVIGNASDGDVITLNRGNYSCISNNYHDIIIDKNLTIKGHSSGYSFIDGGGQNSSTLFRVSPGASLTLISVTLYNFQNKTPTIYNYGTLNVINSTFENGISSIFLWRDEHIGSITNYGNLYVDNSYFISHTSAIYNNGTNVVLKNSYFDKLSGSFVFGINNHGLNFTIDGCEFTLSNIENYGANFKIINSSFKNSGKIYNTADNFSFINSVIMDSMTMDEAFIISDTNNVLILNSSFLRNTVAVMGGVILVGPYTNIINSTFIGNGIGANPEVVSTIFYTSLGGNISGCIFFNNTGKVNYNNRTGSIIYNHNLRPSNVDFNLEYSVFLNNINADGSKNILGIVYNDMGYNVNYKIDNNFWGTHYSFSDVQSIVNNLKFNNFYYYEFYTNYESLELYVGDNLQYLYGIYYSSTGKATNVEKLPSDFLFSIIQGQVTDLDNINNEEVNTPSSGHNHGGSVIPPSSTPSSYTNLKTINTVQLSDNGFYSSKLPYQYTIFILSYNGFNLDNFLYVAGVRTPSSSPSNNEPKANDNLFNTNNNNGNGNTNGVGGGSGNGIGGGNGDGVGGGSGLGSSDDGGSGSGNNEDSLESSGLFDDGDENSDSSNKSSSLSSSKSLKSGLSGLIGGGGSGDNSNAYEITETSPNKIDNSYDFLKYFIILLFFVFLLLLGLYYHKNKGFLLK